MIVFYVLGCFLSFTGFVSTVSNAGAEILSVNMVIIISAEKS